MKTLNFIGKRVVKKNGDINTVVSINFEKNYLVTLDDGKLGYDIRLSIPRGLLRFEEDEFQKQVLEKLQQLRTEKPSEQPLNNYSSIIKEAIALFKGEGVRRNISSTYANNFSSLQFGKIYGTKALDIYKSCCKELGFDWAQRGYFNLQQILYAYPATPEKYGVWMLPNNSTTGRVSGCWANVIRGDKIYEVRNIKDLGDSHDRVTFLKQGNGEYVFIGVYSLEKIEKINEDVDGISIYHIKIYKRVSETYPS